MLYTLFLVWMASKGCDFPAQAETELTKQPGVLFLFTVLFFEPSAGGLNSLVVPVLAGLRRGFPSPQNSLVSNSYCQECHSSGESCWKSQCIEKYCLSRMWLTGKKLILPIYCRKRIKRTVLSYLVSFPTTRSRVRQHSAGYNCRTLKVVGNGGYVPAFIGAFLCYVWPFAQ